MQAQQPTSRPKFLGVISIALFSILILTGCGGGGSTGATAFNLPSIPVRVQPDNTIKVFGINTGAALPAGLVQQLQSAGVQELEVRPGYNGLHIYRNGEDLPYIKWDEGSLGTVQNLLNNAPPELGIPSSLPLVGAPGDLLPLLRQFGLGVNLDIPVAAGGTAVNVPAWSRETTVTTEEAGATTLGPLTVGSLAFTPEGNATVEGIPLSDLGVNVAIPAAVMGLLSSIGADQLSVVTQPNGIDLSLGDLPLPSIAYDSASLGRVLEAAKPFVTDPSMAGILEDIVPKLSGADINLAVSLTGEPAVDTSISEIPVEVNADGTMSAFGLPLGNSPVLTPDLLAQLQAANVQALDVNVADNTLMLAVNKMKLPLIKWSDASLNTFATKLAPALGIDSPQIGGGVEIFRKIIDKTPVGAKLNLPLAAGAGAVDMPAEIDMTMAPAELNGASPPVIHLEANYVGNQLDSVFGLSGSELEEGGVSLPPLPDSVVDIFNNLGASQVQLLTIENALLVNVDGETLLSLGYDAASLGQALTLATPFLGDSPLGDPALSQFIVENILPLVPGSDVNVTINLQ